MAIGWPQLNEIVNETILTYNLTKLLQNLLSNMDDALCTAETTYSIEGQSIKWVINSAVPETIELYIKHNAISGIFLNVINNKKKKSDTCNKNTSGKQLL